jgi:hypothetical protein
MRDGKRCYCEFCLEEDADLQYADDIRTLARRHYRNLWTVFAGLAILAAILFTFVMVYTLVDQMQYVR